MMSSARYLPIFLATVSLLPSLAFAEVIVRVVQPDFSLVVSLTEDNRDQLVTEFASKGELSVTTFTLSDPARLVMDISGVEKPTTFAKILHAHGIDRVRGGAYEEKQRIVLVMEGGVEISLLNEGVTEEGASSIIEFRETKTAHTVEVTPTMNRQSNTDRQSSRPFPFRLHGFVVDQQSNLLSDDESSSSLAFKSLIEEELRLSSQDSCFTYSGEYQAPTAIRLAPREVALLDSEEQKSLPVVKQLMETAQQAASSALSILAELLSSSLYILLLPLTLLFLSLAGLLLIKKRGSKQTEAPTDLYDEDEPVKLPTEIIELPTLREAYRILGCYSDDNDDRLKANYRRLIKVFHEDKLVSKDLPSELMTVSRREFDRIRAAFERLKIERPTL
ncbi:MAG: AMIN domain-containing protein [Bdellovibrionales bacterium]|nr:AMIN domain-containing protein [Bdellovibrionales bacterium]